MKADFGIKRWRHDLILPRKLADLPHTAGRVDQERETCAMFYARDSVGYLWTGSGRSIAFCCFAFGLIAPPTGATVHVQLNLRYDNPGDFTSGGTWELLVKSDEDGVANLAVGVNDVTDAISAGNTGFDYFEAETVGVLTEIATGYLPEHVAPATDVGIPGGRGAVADDLYPIWSPFWSPSALIAKGSFGSTRPSFAASGHAVEVFNGTDRIAGDLGMLVVRGDSVEVDGLLPADVNRNGDVDGDDLSEVLIRFHLPSNGLTWDSGDLDSDGDINGDDLNIVLLYFNEPAAIPPPLSASRAISHVPEPSSLLLCLVTGLICAPWKARTWGRA